MKQAKGFWGDRKNHLRLTSDAVMRAMASSYRHRKERKGDFRALWISRLSVAAKIHGLSYNALIAGLKKFGSILNRKMLSELAIRDPQAFGRIVEQVKQIQMA